MELKDFIKTTMQAIIDATSELIEANKDTGAKINPLRPGFSNDRVNYYDGSVPITEVLFDVAVTESTGKTASAGAGIEVLKAKIGADGEISNANENASRVEFTLSAALPATPIPPRKQRFDGTMGKDES